MSGNGQRQDSLVRPALLIIADLLMLESAFLVTYWFRFHAGIWPVPLGIPPLDVYLVASAVILVVFFFIFYASGLYGRPPGGSLEQDLTDLFKGVVLGSLLVLAIAFFFRQMTFSRSFFGLFFLSCFFFLTLGRILVRLILGRILRRGLGLTRVLLVGSNPMRARLVRSCRELPGLNLELVGWLRASEDEDPVAAAAETEGLPCLGGVEDVRETVRERGIDLVVLTLPFDQLALVRDIAAQLGNLNADLKFAPDLMALHTSRMRLTEIAGIPFISVREVALSGADRIVKRTFDLVAATAGLLVISPLLLLISLLVKLSSPGPVFFRQERIGRDGRAFTMIKFRTMRPDAEERSGPVWTVEGDPRVTTLGRVLRRLSLDELPQLWNVVRGDMSLVGPRPERRVFVDEFSQRMPRYFERHRVRSGLTGWAQVHGLRGNTSIEERTLYDLHYVENWSLALDVKIILMTINHVLWGENAY